MMDKETMSFDATPAYNKTIAPLVQELCKMCYREGIPMFLTCVVKENGVETQYKSEMISAEKAHRTLSDNRLSNHIRVLNGYKTIAPSDEDELSYA